MTFGLLALVITVALLGPLLAGLSRWRLPAAIGELSAGIAIGGSGLGLVDSTEPTFSFLGSLGFALTMFVVGSHVPLRDARLRPALASGFARLIGIGIVAAFTGNAIALWFGTGHGWLYTVLLASSSAALILPTVDQLRLGGAGFTSMLAQVAIADTVSIVALPLAMAPDRAGEAAVGAVGIAILGVFLALGLGLADRFGLRSRLHRISVRHSLALELRLSLAVLVGLAALAKLSGVSVLLAGFATGLAVAAIGEPRRLARQLFGVTEGFFAPLFFVWLGTSLSLKSLFTDPALVGLGLVLGIGAIAVHLTMVVTRQQPLWSVIAATQLGVPSAAVAIGTQTGSLSAGESAALILGALVTIVGLAAASSLAARLPNYLATGSDHSSHG